MEAAKLNGTFVTVPINIHRINNLFYNTSVVEEAGVDPTSFSSPSDLVDACETIASETDAVPFAHQTSGAWSTGQLFGSTLIATGGPDGYDSYTSGEGSEGDVRAALEHIVALREYYPDNASSIGFTEANTMVQEGDAAFIHQGDWAAGAYTGNDEFNYEENWNQVPYPGTSGSYQLNMDSFPFFDNNPSPEATKIFLSYCGTTDAQIRFNKQKGSIPPREDADVSELNAFQQDQFDDFTSADSQPPSIQHGLAVAPAILTNFGEAMSAFIESYNVDQTTSDLMGIFS
jgi:glucose/mannose transport system substrate-binding protein